MAKTCKKYKAGSRNKTHGIRLPALKYIPRVNPMSPVTDAQLQRMLPKPVKQPLKLSGYVPKFKIGDVIDKHESVVFDKSDPKNRLKIIGFETINGTLRYKVAQLNLDAQNKTLKRTIDANGIITKSTNVATTGAEYADAYYSLNTHYKSKRSKLKTPDKLRKEVSNSRKRSRVQSAKGSSSTKRKSPQTLREEVLNSRNSPLDSFVIKA